MKIESGATSWETSTSSFALERADNELSLGAWRTGLLTYDVMPERLRLPTLRGQWHMQSRMRRLQLRGSGGFSPRFPNIAPAELRFMLFWLQAELLISLQVLLNASRRETKTHCGAEAGWIHASICRVIRAETNFDGFRESSSTLPTEVDSHRCGLDRSPGLRFVGAKRPSQRLSASGILLLRSSTLTVAGAAPDLHRLPIRHQVTFLYDEGEMRVKLGRVWDRKMTICWREIDCGLFAARCRRALRGVGRF